MGAVDVNAETFSVALSTAFCTVSISASSIACSSTSSILSQDLVEKALAPSV